MTGDVDLNAYLRRCRAYYAYFNQAEIWLPNGRSQVRIVEMDAAWRLNCARFLERRAASYLAQYDFGEISALSQPTCQEVVGEDRGEVVLSGQVFSELDLMGECARDAFDGEAERRRSDPIAWVRSTPLYRALVAGLPTGDDRDALAERAKHWSTCPARSDLAATCGCHLSECAIRNGHPELGCTCRDSSPEWTL